MDMMILDVAMCLFFVYFLGSAVCSAAQEWIARFGKQRAKSLEEAIAKMLGPEMRKDFFAHPLIKSLSLKGSRLPSYVGAKMFAQTVTDLAKGASETITTESLRDTIKTLPDPDTRRSLLLFLDQAEGEVGKFRESVEEWFDASMDRVSGWYRRNVQRTLMLLSIGLCLLLNIDTLALSTQFAQNRTLRDTVVAAAEARVKAGAEIGRDQIERDVELLQLGWSAESGRWSGAGCNPLMMIQLVVLKIIGLAISAVAISQGAPFWFDLLCKVSDLRSGGPKPKKAGAGAAAAG